MTTDFGSLSLLAVSIGFFHCLCGPDHYVPFVAMSRVGMWSLRKTLLVTILCGMGHVLGSVLLGLLGVAAGWLLFEQMTNVESIRAAFAAWMLVAFGLLYFLWGVRHAVRRAKAGVADEEELMEGAAAEARGTIARAGSFTPWILFVLFLFGPCEPLIPILMVPAANTDLWMVAWVSILFALSTLVTMTCLVAFIYLGSIRVRFQWAQIYGHALAGLIVLLCGLAMVLEPALPIAGR